MSSEPRPLSPALESRDSVGRDNSTDTSTAQALKGGPLRARVRRLRTDGRQPTAEAPSSDAGLASSAASPADIGQQMQLSARASSEPPNEVMQVEVSASTVHVETEQCHSPPDVTAATTRAAPIADPQQLETDLEAELQAALGDQPIEKLMGTVPVDLPKLQVDSRLMAVVLRCDREHVFFSLGGPYQGVAPLGQFVSAPEPGTRVEVVIRSYNEEDDLYEVVVPGAAQSVTDWSDLVEGSVVEARITGANTGGLECMVNHIRGFIPASQIALYRVEHLTEYIGQKMLCVVTEVNPKRRNLVLSRRAILEREKEEARRARLNELNEGDIVEGVVRSIQKFGVFVDLGEIDGLIHISKLSWDRVEDPAEVVSVGQRVRARIEAIDRQTGKIALSLRMPQEHPWARAAELFPLGAIVQGTVSRLAKFGAFVKLAPGIEGLLHISELSHQRVPSVAAVLQEGQQVEVKVIALDVEQQRIGLSLKALSPPPPPKEEEPKPADNPAVQPPPRQERPPLKGGLDRPSGGERFGLRW